VQRAVAEGRLVWVRAGRCARGGRETRVGTNMAQVGVVGIHAFIVCVAGRRSELQPGSRRGACLGLVVASECTSLEKSPARTKPRLWLSSALNRTEANAASCSQSGLQLASSAEPGAGNSKLRLCAPRQAHCCERNE
jgi:hypothetical protein